MGNYHIGARLAMYRVVLLGKEKPLKEIDHAFWPKSNERVVFPARGHALPPRGELWAWEIVAENPRRTVWFARPLFRLSAYGVDTYTDALAKRVDEIRRVIDDGYITVVVGERPGDLAPQTRRLLRYNAAVQADKIAETWFKEKYASIDALLSNYGLSRMEEFGYLKKSPEEPDSFFWQFMWDQGVVVFDVDCATMPSVPDGMVSQLTKIVGWEPHVRRVCRWYAGDTSPGFGPHGTDFEGHEW